MEGLKPHQFLANFRNSVEGSEGTLESFQYGKQLTEGILPNFKSVNMLK